MKDDVNKQNQKEVLIFVCVATPGGGCPALLQTCGSQFISEIHVFSWL